MKLRSSANIELITYSLLIRACKVKKISLSKMISFIMRNAVTQHDFNNQIVLFRNVKYQRKGLKYKLIHFYFEAEEYESCLDIRKFGKVSVSSVLNIWIKKILGRADFDKNEGDFKVFMLKLDNYAIKYQVIIDDDVERVKMIIKINRKIHYT
ncbi:MAG TPA: hypothetical protein PLH15_07820 [Spirochaetota bacterium]|nr:hypothetical protein [Spirochaetota bacterium]HQO23116.1 hypothetical protein [Spirochaetota bacterium]HQQ23730.1 hypothetical protein [Spirochaetota bacterium]